MPPSLPAAVQIYLDRTKQSSARVVPLTGDASDRRYFRVLPLGGRSFVLAVNVAPFDYKTLPFVNVAELFAVMPLPVPRILGEAADHGVLALDDLGDVTLQAHVGAAPAAVETGLSEYGMRLGTAAVTTRGFGEVEMVQIAAWVHEVIKNFGNAEIEARIAEEVKALTSRFPVPGITD